MTDAERISDAETRARTVGLTVTDLCRAAGVHRATWQRWKASRGGGPKIAQWEAVERCLRDAAKDAAA